MGTEFQKIMPTFQKRRETKREEENEANMPDFGRVLFLKEKNHILNEYTVTLCIA